MDIFKRGINSKNIDSTLIHGLDFESTLIQRCVPAGEACRSDPTAELESGGGRDFMGVKLATDPMSKAHKYIIKIKQKLLPQLTFIVQYPTHCVGFMT